MKHAQYIHSKHAQRGVSSFIVMMVLILSLASVLVAQRVGILNEAFMGSDSDAQRTHAAAEAVMQDAKLDVRGFRLAANGVDKDPCVAGLPTGTCRAAGEVFFPADNSYTMNLHELKARVASTAFTGEACVSGICTPASPLAPFWLTDAKLNSMKAKAAKYGQFTGTSAAGNDILQNKAWYWVEVLPYLRSNGDKYAPNIINPAVFRITVIAEGAKAGSRTIIQTYYVPNLQDPTFGGS